MITPTGLMRALPLLVSLVIPTSCAVEVGPPAHEVTYYDASGDVVYVNDAPPAPREEVFAGVAPGPTYVWVGGYWARHGTGWHWVPGRWVSRPREGVVWVPGHWDHHPRGYFWIQGHWR